MNRAPVASPPSGEIARGTGATQSCDAAEQRPIRDNILFIVGGVGYTILGALCCIFVTESNVSDLRDLSVIVDLSDAPRPCPVCGTLLAAMMTDLNTKASRLSPATAPRIRSMCRRRSGARRGHRRSGRGEAVGRGGLRGGA